MVSIRTAHVNQPGSIYGLRMSELVSSSRLTAQTLAQIDEIDRRIASLAELRSGLERVLKNVIGGDALNTPKAHLTSSKQAMMEHVILNILEAADGGPLKTRELFNSVRSVSAHLKYATFRSHLHRLKKRGAIASEDNSYASWKLCAAARIAANQDTIGALSEERAITAIGLECNPDGASAHFGGMRLTK
jgi:hypothetical protein